MTLAFSAAATADPLPAASARPHSAAADPALSRLAKEFEPRVSALVQRIARDKAISRKAIEDGLGVELRAAATRPGQAAKWAINGLFEPGHGFLIELEDRETDIQLTVAVSATGVLGCHLTSNPIRTSFVDRLQYSAHGLGAGKRPFTLLQPTDDTGATVRLFDQTITAANGNKTKCVYLLDIAVPKKRHGRHPSQSPR